MADAWAITFTGHGFSGDKLFSASDGTYEFTPGLRRRRILLEEMPPGCGEVVKYNGKSGARLTLELSWFTTSATASTVWAASYAKCDAAWDGVSGTLTVPGFPAFANCVVMDVAFDKQTPIGQPTPLNAGSTGWTDGYLVTAQIIFEQTGG